MRDDEMDFRQVAVAGSEVVAELRRGDCGREMAEIQPSARMGHEHHLLDTKNRKEIEYERQHANIVRVQSPAASAL